MPETDLDLSPAIQSLLGQAVAQPQQPVDEKPSSVIGILGNALGGGTSRAVPMSAGEKDEAGGQALLNFGLNMLANSGWTTDKKTFGQIAARGIAGAQESLHRSQAVTAAQRAALRDEAKEGRADQLERLKTAIPLLKLQEEQATNRRLQNLRSPWATPEGGGGGGAGTPGATGPGAGTPVSSIEVPPDLMPHFQAAAARTGIPVDVLIAQARQESNFNPNARGDAGEIGIGQIKPSTAADPGGMPGIDPAKLTDASTNINFMADYLRSRMPPGADPKDPAVIRAALLRYNGGGDKNYVNNVTRYLPATAAGAQGGEGPQGLEVPKDFRLAGSPGSPSTPGQTQTAQVAGLGAPPDASPRPVAATPPQTATPPTAAPGAPGDAPKPEEPAPGTFAHYHKQHWAPPDADTRKLFNPSPDPEQLAGIARQRQFVRSAYDTAKARNDGAGMEQAQIKMAELDGAANTLRQNAREAGEKREAEWRQKQTDLLHQGWTAEQAARTADAGKQTEHERAKELEKIRADTAANQSELTHRLSRNQVVFEQLDKDTLAARGAVSELDGLLSLSNNVDKPNLWGTIKIGETSVLNRMAQLDLVDKGEAGATQMLQAGIANAVIRLKSGVSMGAMSDRDLDFIQSMAPNMFQNKETRGAIISYLRRAQDQKIRFNVEVSKLMSKPGMTIADAMDQAATEMEKRVPIVPVVSQELHDNWTNPDPEWVKARTKWAKDHNIRPGTMFRNPDGTLEITHSPGSAAGPVGRGR